MKCKIHLHFLSQTTIYHVNRPPSDSRSHTVLLVTILLGCAVAATMATYTHGDGKPGCRLAEEFGRKYRNNWDPIRYWVCQGRAAVSFVCPIEHLYADRNQGCVHYTQWVWTMPYDPPTLG